MADQEYNYTKETEFAAYAPVRRAEDITPGVALVRATRAVMVSETAALTGILVGQDASHTTFNLEPGILYPFAFESISAISAGSVKGYT